MNQPVEVHVLERLQTAIRTVAEARGVPLSASAVIHRAEMLEILNQASEALPYDLEAAQSLLADREAVLEDARRTADGIIAHAREEVAQMVAQTQIVAEARREAARISEKAEDDARQQRDEIEAYIDSRLATLEVILNKTLDVVQRGREKLQGNDENRLLTELRQ
jgi:F0F1-type ATP synthase membrane subunit b/b'